MSYFRKTEQVRHWFDQLEPGGKWLIPLNADPDAMASAMALRRILEHKEISADIVRINDISRPDNLAMIRYTRLYMRRFQPGMEEEGYNHLALVDSQPSHNPQFAGLDFSVIIDHHPEATSPAEGRFMEIKPEYGASSTILTEYLYNLDIRFGSRLATALQFGIRTDTANFQRHVCEVDLRAYQYLGKFADQELLSRIIRSELRLDWLPDVARAIACRREVGGGHMAVLGDVDSPDILVLIADFLTRVYEIRWLLVAGIHNGTVIVIFRGDGLTMDVGRLAQSRFGSLGSAGGHRSMARAEFPVEAAQGAGIESFIRRTLTARLRKTGGQAAEAILKTRS